MRARRLVASLLQQSLPRALRFYFFVPIAIGVAYLGAIFFMLPPGPLCDEGMVLFMEGGCDWGYSNVFFLSKLGALLSVNLAFVIAGRQPPAPAVSYLPHLLLLCWLGWHHRSGAECDNYYSHPNGSVGQMAVEIAAFAILGITLVPFVRSRSLHALAIALASWNLVHVLVFYAWLPLANHWTWRHTWLLCSTLVVLAIGCVGFRYRRESRTRAGLGSRTSP